VIERVMPTLKERCLYPHRFATRAAARRRIDEFIDRYDAEWLIERRATDHRRRSEPPRSQRDLRPARG
jgi:hypothetical protein